MELTWATFREICYAIGSTAGVIAFIRPLLDEKLKRDQNRIDHVKELLPEQLLIDLEPEVWNSRCVPASTLSKFMQLEHEVETNQDSVRFSGPTAKHLKQCLKDIVASYNSLREYVQVPEWEPSQREEGTLWIFNKGAFADEHGIPKNYAKHLEEAAQAASQITKAFQRFQVTAELHLYEIPFARWLLPMRYRQHNLS